MANANYSSSSVTEKKKTNNIDTCRCWIDLKPSLHLFNFLCSYGKSLESNAPNSYINGALKYKRKRFHHWAGTEQV